MISKHRVLLIFIFGLIVNLSAQDKKIGYHISIGPTLSIPKTSELTNTNVDGSPEIKSSLNVGAFILPSINYCFSEKSSIDFGVGFFLDRFNVEDRIGAVTNNGNRNISQIQIPINYNFHFSEDKSWHLGLGAFTSFLISAKEKGDSEVDNSLIDILDPSDPNFMASSVSYNKNIKDNYNSVSFGVFLQLKKHVSFSTNTKGYLLFRINQYFNSIKNADNSSDISEFIELKNEKEPTTINIGVGLFL